jgi:putative transposase
MDAVLREEIMSERSSRPGVRLLKVLEALGLSASSWYYRPVAPEQRQTPGPKPQPLPAEVVALVKSTSETYPWYGYQKIAVICRRTDPSITDRQSYQVMRMYDLLHKRPVRSAAVHQTRKLYELLPQRRNALWQMDVTYVHIPGHGWWYAITVIDYYSRYLLACRLTWSYCAIEAIAALEEARTEAERLCGPLPQRPFLVTDNGSSFIARRFEDYVGSRYEHVRIQYRTPTQLGLLERFHRTFKAEEVYWRLYDSPADARQCFGEFRQRYNTIRPHWALVPAEGGDPLTPQDVYVGGRAIEIPAWQAWARRAREQLEQWATEEAA